MAVSSVGRDPLCSLGHALRRTGHTPGCGFMVIGFRFSKVWRSDGRRKQCWFQEHSERRKKGSARTA